MENVQEKLIDDLFKAEKEFMNGEHFLKKIMPIVNDLKILVRVLENFHSAAVGTMGVVLKIEYLHKRIKLFHDKERNLRTFYERCAEKYGLGLEDLRILDEMMRTYDRHKESVMEFSKNGNVVLMQEDGKTDKIGTERIERFRIVVRKLIENVRQKFLV